MGVPLVNYSLHTPRKTREQLQVQAYHLLEKIATHLRSPDSCGFFSPTVYDSAWLSMIAKHVDGRTKHWLFPQCFQYILSQQQEDGEWECYNSQVDGILNTAAALLALSHHRCLNREVQNQLSPQHQDSAFLAERIERGRRALQSLLLSWDVQNTVHVGFEILVPSLLKQLETYGLEFSFPQKQTLMIFAAKKLDRFDQKVIYDRYKQTTLLHSLEGLMGLIDYDEVKHHVTSTHGILGSPSSTAAYLMNCSIWDDKAESYLHRVMRAYECTGAVPSAFPTSIFETTWTFTILQDAGVLLEGAFSNGPVQVIRQFINDTFFNQSGLLGFSPGILADLDDTAKAISLLQALGDNPSPAAMIHEFEGKTRFKTYAEERNPSFSANCNALVALLGYHDKDDVIPLYQSQIGKTLTFLLEVWNNGKVIDKWNLTSEYSELSFVNALVTALSNWSQGRLPLLDSESLRMQLVAACSSVLGVILRRQCDDGSWDGCVETSAYSLILLSRLNNLPFSGAVSQLIEKQTQKGTEFLWDHRSSWTKANHKWVEKVTYGSPILSEAYCLAAVLSNPRNIDWNSDLRLAFGPPSGNASKILKFFTGLPVFREIPATMLEIAQLEAKHYTNQLQRTRLEIFSKRDATMTEDKYLAYIPLAWTSCNILAEKRGLSGSVMWQMMRISLVNYQIDEFMETVLATSNLSAPPSEFVQRVFESAAHGVIDAQASQLAKRPSSLGEPEISCMNIDGEDSGIEGEIATGLKRNRDPCESPVSSKERSIMNDQHRNLSDHHVEATIRIFVDFILQSDPVHSSPAYVRRLLAHELLAFLQAHCQHNDDNRHFRRMLSDFKLDVHSNYSAELPSVPPSLYSWIRNTGSIDTSCPYSFVYFCCLISRQMGNTHCLGTSEQSYIAQTLSHSLASACRLFNDLGSWDRDSAERNLNSLHFTEFATHNKSGLSQKIAPTTGRALVWGPTTEDMDNSGSSQEMKPFGDHLLNNDGSKQALVRIGDFEMAAVQMAFERLQLVTPKHVCDAIQIFVHVTDLFGQIYVARDIASRAKSDRDA